MAKEVFSPPISLHRTKVTGLQFSRTPEIVFQLPVLLPYRILSEAMVELAVAEGTIVTWRTDESIPVGFGTIQVVPVWRFLLEMEPRT